MSPYQLHNVLAMSLMGRIRSQPLTCRNSIQQLVLASRAIEAAETGMDPQLQEKAERLHAGIKRAIHLNCREASGTEFMLDGLRFRRAARRRWA